MLTASRLARTVVRVGWQMVVAALGLTWKCVRILLVVLGAALGPGVPPPPPPPLPRTEMPARAGDLREDGP